jgi:hypothetical protein
MEMANELEALPRTLRGRTVAFVLLAHVQGLDLGKLVEAGDNLHRLGVLINQSLKLSHGQEVDRVALAEAVQLIKKLRP